MSEKKIIARNIGASFLMIGGIAAIAMILYATTREYKRVKRIDTLIAEQKDYRDHVERKNTLLAELIAYKETTISRERAARERGYKNPDENVVVIKNDTLTEYSEPQTTSLEKDLAAMEPYRAWHYLFFQKKEIMTRTNH